MINKKNMRAGYGEIVVEHRGIPIPTSVGSRRYEAMFSGQSGMINQTGANGNIPNGY